MIALARARRDFHLAEQGIHLGDRKHPPGPHRTVTGDGRGDMIQLVAKGQRPPKLGDFGGKVGEQLCGSVLPNAAGTARTTIEPAPNLSTSSPISARSAAAASMRSQSGSSRSTTSGMSNSWRATPPPSRAAAHPFEHQPLMRRMLVDDDQPVLGFGNDIGGRHLSSRHPQRISGNRPNRGLGARRRRRNRSARTHAAPRGRLRGPAPRSGSRA